MYKLILYFKYILIIFYFLLYYIIFYFIYYITLNQTFLQIHRPLHLQIYLHHLKMQHHKLLYHVQLIVF